MAEKRPVKKPIKISGKGLLKSVLTRNKALADAAAPIKPKKKK